MNYTIDFKANLIKEKMETPNFFKTQSFHPIMLLNKILEITFWHNDNYGNAYWDYGPLVEEKFRLFLIYHGVDFCFKNSIFSFKVGNYFFKFSSRTFDCRLEEFMRTIPYGNIFFLGNNLPLIYWQDEEIEYDLLDTNTLYILFESLVSYKNYIFKDLCLEDIYFSKIYGRFFIKNFENFVPVPWLNIPPLQYEPQNILNSKGLFKYGNTEINFNEALSFSPNKNILGAWL